MSFFSHFLVAGIVWTAGLYKENILLLPRFSGLILLSKIPSAQLFGEFHQYFTWIDPGAQTISLSIPFSSPVRLRA